MLGKGLVDKSIEIVKIWVTWTCLLRSRPWLWTTLRGNEKCSVACPIRHQELWVQYGRWGVDQLLPVGLSYAWMETSPSGGRWNFVVCVSECFVHFSKAKLLYIIIFEWHSVYTQSYHTSHTSSWTVHKLYVLHHTFLYHASILIWFTLACAPRVLYSHTTY